MKVALFRRAETALGAAAAWHLWAPGRIEFMGKHTDYAGGRSLVFATEQGFAFALRPAAGSRARITDAASGESLDIPLSADLEIPAGDWAAYPMTVIRRLVRNFPGIDRGFDLAFASDLPSAAGISSSSALVVGVYLALQTANALDARADWRAAFPTPEHLAGYLGAVENGRTFGAFPGDSGVGTQGGSQDQTAILWSRAGEIRQYGWDPVTFERTLPWPRGHIVAVGVCGVTAAKTREALEAYNAASTATVELLARWNAATGRRDPTLARALRSGPDARHRLAAALAGAPARLRARLEQFYTESEELIPAAGDALLRGDLRALGELVDRSQAGAEQGLHNQIPETIHLQRSARRLGAVAASAFGAGFGGSVWALVPEPAAAGFLAAWEQDYAVAFPARSGSARYFLTHAGPGHLIRAARGGDPHPGPAGSP